MSRGEVFDLLFPKTKSIVGANGDYDMNERRYLCRLMLKGEAPI